MLGLFTVIWILSFIEWLEKFSFTCVFIIVKKFAVFEILPELIFPLKKYFDPLAVLLYRIAAR